MRLDLDRTPIGQSELPVAGSFDLDLGSEDPVEVKVAGDLRVDNLEGRVVVRGKLTGTAGASCGRCLQVFALEFQIPVALVILCDAGHETDDAMTPVIHQRRGLVDLSDTLREATVLAVPQAQICREDCRGLCVRCGADLNAGSCDCVDDEVDPRWEGLPD